MRLRRFNDEGIAAFRDYLRSLRENPAAPPPVELLTRDDRTIAVPEAIEIDRPGFTTKRDAATYLHPKLGPLMGPGLFRDAGLWTWLSLFYFDDVCPAKDGKRKVNEEARYILNAANWLKRYRHLLASPVRVLVLSSTHNRLLLDAKLIEFRQVDEDLHSRLFVNRTPSIFEAVDRLFFDPVKGGPKSGIGSKTPKAGDLRTRFPIRLDQLSRTYDANAMNANQLLLKLGREFEGWLKTP